MGHCVTAFIAGSEVIERLRERCSLPAIELRDGWHLVPLEDEDLDGLKLDFSCTIDGFNYLSTAVERFCVELSCLGPLVFLETDYFGGLGSQGAAAFVNGSIVSPGPFVGEGAINQALRCLGIAPAGDQDGFDYMGLSRHRHTSGWKEAAKPPR